MDALKDVVGVEGGFYAVEKRPHGRRIEPTEEELDLTSCYNEFYLMRY